MRSGLIPPLGASSLMLLGMLHLSLDKPANMHFGLVKEESDASRLRSLKSFFVTSVLFFVSMIVLCIEGNGSVGIDEKIGERA